MSATETRQALWVAYGPGGVVGSIRKIDGAYLVSMVGGASEPTSYPSMEIAKSALHARMRPGADWPEFREH